MMISSASICSIKFISTLIRAGIISLAFLAFGTQAANPQLLQEAQTLLSEGKSLEAFDLLSPFEFDYAGEVGFDYLLGLSLLDSGEPGKSVFAFQRVLAVDPNFAGARIELARAYFDMSQFTLARAEFITLQNQSPPANVQLVITQYLTAIQNRTLSKKEGWSGYVQLGLGNDSNANNATNVNSFLGFSLTEQSRETSSSLVSTIGGVSYDFPVSYFRTYYVRSNLNNRDYNDASFASSFSYDISTGIKQSFKSGDSLGVSFQAYSAEVNGSSNSKGVNLNSQYNVNFSASNQLGVFIRLGEINYVEAFDIKDVTQSILGLSWAHVFSNDLRPSVITTLIGGQDDAELSTSPYGRSYSGARITLAVAITHRTNLFTSVGSSNSTFDGQFFGLAGDRKDEFNDFSLGTSWRFNKFWTLKALVNVVENKSNIDIFSYDKKEVLFIVRSDFLP
jgi:tetratricopeptide (TPR) repeat protein